jgi:uncharacterized protein YdbL (DUF1318 family)
MPALRPLLLALTLALTPLAAFPAADKAELKVAFDARATALAAAKSAGTLGETTSGLLAVPAGASADAATLALLTAENADRTTLFALLATETGATPAVVAERYARRAYQEAAAGMWLQKKDGTWARK